MTQDPWVLELVNQGLQLDFLSTPFQDRFVPNMLMNENQKQICTQEVNELLSKGAVISASSIGFVSPLFVIPKKTGGFRPIINLKYLNEFIRYTLQDGEHRPN